ncbi:hypothetical protein BI330_06030 [Mycobacterium sp. CBMA 623]|nr:hypothetical protein [Mycobacteroides sp. CBMA 326]
MRDLKIGPECRRSPFLAKRRSDQIESFGNVRGRIQDAFDNSLYVFFQVCKVGLEVRRVWDKYQ